MKKQVFSSRHLIGNFTAFRDTSISKIWEEDDKTDYYVLATGWQFVVFS